MGLKGYREPTRTFKLPTGDELIARGLNLMDVSAIVFHHGPALNALFKVKDGQVALPAGLDVAQIIADLGPDIVARVIAHGVGEPDEIQVARSLPIGLQIELAEAIGEMTFSANGGLKNFIAIVTRLLQGGRELIQQPAA